MPIRCSAFSGIRIGAGICASGLSGSAANEVGHSREPCDTGGVKCWFGSLEKNVARVCCICVECASCFSSFHELRGKRRDSLKETLTAYVEVMFGTGIVRPSLRWTEDVVSLELSLSDDVSSSEWCLGLPPKTSSSSSWNARRQCCRCRAP